MVARWGAEPTAQRALEPLGLAQMGTLAQALVYTCRLPRPKTSRKERQQGLSSLPGAEGFLANPG